MLERWLALVALLAGAFAASAAPEGGASAAAGEHTVIIENMQFAPATLAVRRGERVVWVNRDLAIDANVSTTGITSATKTRPTKVFADGLTRVCVFDAALVLYGLWPGWGADPRGIFHPFCM